MIIKRFKVNPLEENCYVAYDDTKECVIVDCGAFTEEEFNSIKNYIDDNALKPVHHILTHGHFDHIAGSTFVEKAYGLKPELHYADEQMYKSINDQMRQLMGMSMNIDLPVIGRCFNNGDAVTFGNTTLKVIATPGHSQGCVFYLDESGKQAFSGDTLFCGSIGRTDFTGGSMFQIINSLRFIAQLDDDIVLYPGHGGETTIGDEVAHNPYMDR